MAKYDVDALCAHEGGFTLFSIHGEHYTKVNMRYAFYPAYKI